MRQTLFTDRLRSQMMQVVSMLELTITLNGLHTQSEDTSAVWPYR